MQVKMIYSGEKEVDLIMLDVFPFEPLKHEFYEDDKLSSAYKAVNFAMTKINSLLNADGLVLKIAKPVGNFKAINHNYLTKIYWNGNTSPKSVSENNMKVDTVKNVDSLHKNVGCY